MLKTVLCVAAVAIALEVASRKSVPVPNPLSSAVFITGTSTGIGRDAALALSCQFEAVFATVRKQEDADSLLQDPAGCSDHLVPVMMDVTREEDREAAAHTVAEELQRRGLTLAAVVHNAGVTTFSPMETVSMDAARWVFEVNYFGVLDLTQRFMPFLHGHGPGARLVCVSSVAGYAGGIPGISVYAASKGAVDQAFGSARRELSAFGIHVALVNPGVILTPIGDKLDVTVDEFRRQNEADGHVEYATMASQFAERKARLMDSGMYAEPASTTSAIRDAVTSGYPRVRYNVGWDARVISVLSVFVPEAVMDYVV